MKKTNRIRKAFLQLVSDDVKRHQTLLYYLEIIIGSISGFMTLINIITGKDLLLVATAATTVISLVNAFCFCRNTKHVTLPFLIFLFKVFALYTYFIITGGTEGFSTIWLLFLPTCGMFAFGKKKGALLSLLMFAELVAFFYTPLKDIALQCEYSKSFLFRFPILYISFFFVGFFLEFVRELTYEETVNLKKQFEFQSQHDQLTGLYNRFGFNKFLSQYIKDAKNNDDFGLLIGDIDYFKKINDTYGHTAGDEVLKYVAQRFGDATSKEIIACRWGGEEFAVLVKESSLEDLKIIAEEIRRSVEPPITIAGEKIYISLSMGVAFSKEMKDITERKIVSAADGRLYKAKDLGRNICVFQD